MKFTRGRIAAIGSLAAVGSLAVVMAGADAHHPEVGAAAVCADDTAVVSVRAFSWITDEGDEHRYNSNIQVSLDGVVIGSGAFLPSNNFQFTIDQVVPDDGATHVARVTALAPFGPNGEFVVQEMFRETTVTVPTDCDESGATTTTTAPRAAAPTTTTVGATGGTVVSTTVPSGGVGGGTVSTTTTPTVPVIVGGVVETRGTTPAAVPVDALPAFAG